MQTASNSAVEEIVKVRSTIDQVNGVASAGQAASATGSDAKKVLEASSSTAERSQLIQRAVRTFLDSVRAA